MRVYLRFTGIASLLIGLQLFNLKIVAPKAGFNQGNNILFHQTLMVSNSTSEQGFAQTNQFGSDFEPRDNGGPDNTRGSGTR